MIPVRKKLKIWKAKWFVSIQLVQQYFSEHIVITVNWIRHLGIRNKGLKIIPKSVSYNRWHIFKKLLFSISGVSADRGMWWKTTEKILVWTTETTPIFNYFWPTKNSNFVWFIAIYLNQNNDDAWTESWGGERGITGWRYSSARMNQEIKNQWSKQGTCYIKKQGIWLRRDWLEEVRRTVKNIASVRTNHYPTPQYTQEGLLPLYSRSGQKWQVVAVQKSLGCRGKLFPRRCLSEGILLGNSPDWVLGTAAGCSLLLKAFTEYA